MFPAVHGCFLLYCGGVVVVVLSSPWYLSSYGDNFLIDEDDVIIMKLKRTWVCI